MNASEYIRLKMSAMVLKDVGGYDYRKGEMNPAIFEEFVGLVLDDDLKPVIWEPFAGHTSKSRTQDFAEEIEGLKLISFDLAPCDPRVVKMDSTKNGPGVMVGGVLFHPPYYGSAAQSSVPGEMSCEEDETGYRERLVLAGASAVASLEPNGLVCAVGRYYRRFDRIIRLDEWYVETFEALGLSLIAVWESEPDVVLIFKKGMKV